MLCHADLFYPVCYCREDHGRGPVEAGAGLYTDNRPQDVEEVSHLDLLRWGVGRGGLDLLIEGIGVFSFFTSFSIWPAN